MSALLESTVVGHPKAAIGLSEFYSFGPNNVGAKAGLNRDSSHPFQGCHTNTTAVVIFQQIETQEHPTPSKQAHICAPRKEAQNLLINLDLQAQSQRT